MTSSSKGLYYWISLLGAPCSTERTNPSPSWHRPLLQGGGHLTWGGKQTHLRYFFTRCIFLSSVFNHDGFNHLISCKLIIFSIKATTTLSSGDVPECHSLCCYQVSAMDLFELFGQAAGPDHSHSGWIVERRGSLRARLGIMCPHSHNSWKRTCCLWTRSMFLQGLKAWCEFFSQRLCSTDLSSSLCTIDIICGWTPGFILACDTSQTILTFTCIMDLHEWVLFSFGSCSWISNY